MFIKVLAKNLSIFSNGQTIFVTFLLEPFFSVLLYYLISPYLNKEKLIVTIILMNIIVQIINIFAQIFVQAQESGILKMIFISNKSFYIFSLSAYFIAVCVSFVQGFSLLILYSFFGLSISISVPMIMISSLLIAIFSFLLGSFVILCFLGTSDPYFGSNMLSGIMPIISSAMLPILFYPDWLQFISYITPFWIIPNTIWTSNPNYKIVIYYLIIYAALFLITFVYRRNKIMHN